MDDINLDLYAQSICNVRQDDLATFVISKPVCESDYLPLAKPYSFANDFDAHRGDTIPHDIFLVWPILTLLLDPAVYGALVSHRRAYSYKQLHQLVSASSYSG